MMVTLMYMVTLMLTPGLWYGIMGCGIGAGSWGSVFGEVGLAPHIEQLWPSIRKEVSRGEMKVFVQAVRVCVCVCVCVCVVCVCV